MLAWLSELTSVFPDLTWLGSELLVCVLALTSGSGFPHPIGQRIQGHLHIGRVANAQGSAPGLFEAPSRLLFKTCSRGAGARTYFLRR